MGLQEVGEAQMGNHQLHPLDAAAVGSFPCPSQQDWGHRCCRRSRGGWICSFQKGIQNAESTAQFTESPLSVALGVSSFCQPRDWPCTTGMLETDANSSMIPTVTEGLTRGDARGPAGNNRH